MKNLRKIHIKSVFVLGSSSDIAKAICIELARRGCTKFHLLARNLENNKNLINHLNKNYKVNITEEKFDLLIDENIRPEVENFDLYLITVGDLGNDNIAKNNIDEAIKISKCNYTGILRWIIEIAKPERLNLKCRLWIFSSVAGDIGRASNYNYGAAKSALTTFSNGIYLRCINKPFSVRIFKAGFISTRMTIGKAPKLLCMNTENLAKSILNNPNRRGIEYLPWWWSLIMKILFITPKSITSKL